MFCCKPDKIIWIASFLPIPQTSNKYLFWINRFSLHLSVFPFTFHSNSNHYRSLDICHYFLLFLPKCKPCITECTIMVLLLEIPPINSRFFQNLMIKISHSLGCYAAPFTLTQCCVFCFCILIYNSRESVSMYFWKGKTKKKSSCMK